MKFKPELTYWHGSFRRRRYDRRRRDPVSRVRLLDEVRAREAEAQLRAALADAASDSALPEASASTIPARDADPPPAPLPTMKELPMSAHRVSLYDAAVLDGVRKTRDGYLVATAKTARTGIQTYAAVELGLTDRKPDEMIRVYRPESEVFDTAAMASMGHRPIVVDHPETSVTAKNWKRLSGGMTGGSIARDGDFVTIDLVLMDQQAIDAWQAGKRELSWGYTSDVQLGDGVSPKGEAYDAVMSNIRCNHLALCREARGGPELRLGDQVEQDRLASLMDGAELGALVQERIETLASAKMLLPRLDATGKSVAEIRREVVVAKKGAESVVDRSDDWVWGTFDALCWEGGGAKPRLTDTDALAAAADEAWRRAGADMRRSHQSGAN